MEKNLFFFNFTWFFAPVYGLIASVLDDTIRINNQKAKLLVKTEYLLLQFTIVIWLFYEFKTTQVAFSLWNDIASIKSMIFIIINKQ